jgi:hypothetical protein
MCLNLSPFIYSEEQKAQAAFPLAPVLFALRVIAFI